MGMPKGWKRKALEGWNEVRYCDAKGHQVFSTMTASARNGCWKREFYIVFENGERRYYDTLADAASMFDEEAC